jgi:hypothetical protein
MIKITNRDYHSRPGISNSGLGYFKRSPAHYRAYKAGLLGDSTEAMKFGTMIHTAILEPELFDSQYVVGPDVARNTKIWKEFVVAHPGKEIIKPDEHETCLKVAGSVMANPTLSHIIRNSTREMSGFWRDPATDIECRFRPDAILVSEYSVDMFDIKTTRDASKDKFYWSCMEYGYFRQAAFYMDGYEAITGDRVDSFTLIAVEDKPPYICQAYVLAPEDIARGRIEYSDLLFRYEECLRTNVWPGYSDGSIQLLTRPERKYA